MREKRYIVDTTLRDGEQSPFIAMNLTQKVACAALLEESGVYQIEAGIPAIGGYEIETIQEIMRNRKRTKISVWCRLAEKDIALAKRCGADIIHISVPVSYTQIYGKLGKNKVWVTKTLAVCVEKAYESGCEEVTIGFEDATRADITFMMVMAANLREQGVRRIRYADTVGVITPSLCARAVADLIANTGIEVEMHTHNDLGMAVANTLKGLKAGALFADTTLLGIGERAGNCGYEELMRAGGRLFDLGNNHMGALSAEEKFRRIMAVDA
ncbi:MAG: homocitrate synthase [Oscillospiraceae bacterium]